MAPRRGVGVIPLAPNRHMIIPAERNSRARINSHEDRGVAVIDPSIFLTDRYPSPGKIPIPGSRAESRSVFHPGCCVSPHPDLVRGDPCVPDLPPSLGSHRSGHVKPL
jgi:hypothetical protein